MHASHQRLQAAAQERHGIEGPSELAKILHELPQTVNNWMNRGVSKAGAMKAETQLGIMSQWILFGTGPRFLKEESWGHDVSKPEFVIRKLANLLKHMPPESRDAIGRQLQALAHAPDSQMLAMQLRRVLDAALIATQPEAQSDQD